MFYQQLSTCLVLILFAHLPSYGQFNACYYDLAKINTLTDSLATNFPTICKKVVIGQSVLGKDIIALKISDNVNTDEKEPETFLGFEIHGGEDEPEQVGIRLARSFCLDYGNDPQITNALDNNEIWIIPIINPDGTSTGLRPNHNFIDLNRNFGYLWNQQDSDPHPYSEPETKALRDFILERNFSTIIDYHSGILGMVYPWYYKLTNCPDHNEVLHLANTYKNQSGYNPSDFTVSAGAALYPTFGSMAEFAYGSLGIYSFAIELKDKINPNSTSNYNPCDLLNVNKPAILEIFNKAGKGITGEITDASTGNPIHAKIRIDNRLPFYSSKINGDYHHFLLQGTYTINVSANGYNDASATIIVSNGVVTTQNFQLTPSNRHAAFKILTCRNRNNTNDPAETWNALGMNDGASYAIGDTGFVVLDMGAIIADISGNDITVHGTASNPSNAYEVFHSNSIDGPWTSLGTGTATTSFDLNGANNARFIKLVDNGMGPGNVQGAGFNLDAVTANATITNVSSLDYSFKSNIILYPNPFKDVIHIKSDLSNWDRIEIFDLTGKLVHNAEYANSIDLKNLNSGIYIAKLTTPQSIQTLKIVKK